MKYFILLLLHITSNMALATVWTVSPTNIHYPFNQSQKTISGQFSNITGAIISSQVQNGDTILLLAGVNGAKHEGNTTYNKSLTFIGSGYNQSKAIKTPTVITGFCDLKKSNCKFIGITFTNGIYYYPPVGSTELINIEFEYCAFESFINVSNTPVELKQWKFTNCIIQNSINMGGFVSSSAIFDHCLFYGSNARIANNNGYLNVNQCVFAYSNPSLDIGSGSPNNTTLSEVKNCIFIGGSLGTVFKTNFINNLSYNLINNTLPPNTSPYGSGNIINQNPLFVSIANNGGASLLSNNYLNIYDFKLQANSPAIINGNQLGLYGGDSLFTKWGEPPGAAVIRQMQITKPTTAPGGTLNIKLKITKPYIN
jgi:hypothetical protein